MLKHQNKMCLGDVWHHKGTHARFLVIEARHAYAAVGVLFLKSGNKDTILVEDILHSSAWELVARVEDSAIS